MWGTYHCYGAFYLCFQGIICAILWSAGNPVVNDC